MSTASPFHGKDGEVYLTAVKVAGIREWTHRVGGDEADATAGGDTSKTLLMGLDEGEGEFAGIFEPDDTGQASIVRGTEVELHLVPAGNTAAETELTGTVQIRSIDYDWSFEGIPGFRCSYHGSLVVQDIPA